MNIISKIHKRFSERLRNSRVLTNPEEFLGPNYKEVLNFWLLIEELSEEQLRVVKERYGAFYDESLLEWLKVRDLAWEASKKVVGKDYAINAGLAAWDVTKSNSAFRVTRELIGMHLILEQQPLMVFEMFLEVL